MLNVDASSVTLQWEANPTATKFRLAYTYDGTNFVPVPPPVGYSTCADAFGIIGHSVVAFS